MINSKTDQTTAQNYPDTTIIKPIRKHLEGRPIAALRDLLDFNSDRSLIPIEQVEPVTEIVKRFLHGRDVSGGVIP